MVENAENVPNLIERISQKKPDIVEFRFDKVRDPSVVRLIAKEKDLPAIATDRSNRDPAASAKLLSEAASAGFEYVDVDLASPFMKESVKEVKSHSGQVIVSFHDFTKTPPTTELNQLLSSEMKANADICKIVTTARELRDNLTLLSFVEERAREARLVSFGMGTEGVPSRILSPLFGAEFTFAALTERERTADGQLSIENIRSVWQILGVQ
jgi:3-dehydroquinate dehydratase type I